LYLLLDTQEPLLSPKKKASKAKLSKKPKKKRESVSPEKQSAFDDHVQGLMGHVAAVISVFFLIFAHHHKFDRPASVRELSNCVIRSFSNILVESHEFQPIVLLHAV